MPNCDFYAAGEDFRGILEFVFAQPGWTLVELASVPDQPLQRFRAADLFLGAHDLARDGALLQLYSTDMGGGIIERHVEFDPGVVGDAKGRTDSTGWGLIQLYLSGELDGRIGKSHTNHNSESRALQWEPIYENELGLVSAWDWTAVARTSRRLNGYIRKMAVDKSGSRVILPHAAARVADGATLAPN